MYFRLHDDGISMSQGASGLSLLNCHALSALQFLALFSLTPTFKYTATTYLTGLYHGDSYNSGEEVHRYGLSKRRRYLAVSDMFETWKRELVLFARLL